jgi:hypothetical protein
MRKKSSASGCSFFARQNCSIIGVNPGVESRRAPDRLREAAGIGGGGGPAV